MYPDGQGLLVVPIRFVLLRQWWTDSVLEVVGPFPGL